MTDVHTRHCCKRCGCKYGDDDRCSVVQGFAEQEHPCGHQYTCQWGDEQDYYEQREVYSGVEDYRD